MFWRNGLSSSSSRTENGAVCLSESYLPTALYYPSEDHEMSLHCPEVHIVMCFIIVCNFLLHGPDTLRQCKISHISACVVQIKYCIFQFDLQTGLV